LIIFTKKLAKKSFDYQGKENSSTPAQGQAAHTVKFLGAATSMADAILIFTVKVSIFLTGTVLPNIMCMNY
jgi:hypothetical protein